MTILLALLVAILYATGVYLMLRRSIVKLIIGLVLIGHAANILIFSAAGVVRGRPPLVPEGMSGLERPYADPLPLALILTAIVISFAIVAFTAVLVRRAWQEIGTDDLDRMNTTDR
ncbi:MAG: Na+/H+ antiporter subunit C [Phycisphaeraceae bacterium]|nr:Na+/H+ antiporter subunit C [Phycisphaeraceae bacterium]